MRLIDANTLTHFVEQRIGGLWIYKPDFLWAVTQQPTVDAVEVPCKIGDFVWAIRSFKGQKHPQRGIVGDMFFTKDMKLMIVVKYVARGGMGKDGVRHRQGSV